jgi:hypothetical protein
MGAEDQPEQNFPFSFAANVKVPFDILSYLGVNIFRDLRFDTWVIQLVLRKLLVNAIPWDTDRRELDDVETNKSQMEEGNRINALAFERIKADFNDLYIFPGAAMFNHSCHDEHNVTWQWDEEIPNRLFLCADRVIKAGEELRIKYSPSRLQALQQHKLLGGPCLCPVCNGRTGSMSPGAGDDIYGNDTSFDDAHDDEWARGRQVSVVSSGFSGPVMQPPPETEVAYVDVNPKRRGGNKGPRVWERGKTMFSGELPDRPEEDEPGAEETSEEEEEEQSDSESESDAEIYADEDDEDYVE